MQGHLRDNDGVSIFSFLMIQFRTMISLRSCTWLDDIIAWKMWWDVTCYPHRVTPCQVMLRNGIHTKQWLHNAATHALWSPSRMCGHVLHCQWPPWWWIPAKTRGDRVFCQGENGETIHTFQHWSPWSCSGLVWAHHVIVIEVALICHRNWQIEIISTSLGVLPSVARC